MTSTIPLCKDCVHCTTPNYGEGPHYPHARCSACIITPAYVSVVDGTETPATLWFCENARGLNSPCGPTGAKFAAKLHPDDQPYFGPVGGAPVGTHNNPE